MHKANVPCTSPRYEHVTQVRTAPRYETIHTAPRYDNKNNHYDSNVCRFCKLQKNGVDNQDKQWFGDTNNGHPSWACPNHPNA